MINEVSHRRPLSILLPLAGILVLLLFLGSGVSAQIGTGPSAFCHVTDGVFTDCDPQTPGNEEWSDITATSQPETGGVVYVDQADLVDNSLIPTFEATGTAPPGFFTPDGQLDHLMLMYESDRTVPLGPDEYVLVHFMTVDEKEGETEESLLHYVVRIYSDSTIQVFVDGEDRGPGRLAQIDTMRGAVGFGPSPTNPTPHVLSEFQIGLEVAGFTQCCYSPDPAWWSSSTPPPPPPKKFNKVSAQVNILTNSGADATHAKEAIKAANKILEKTDVRLQLVGEPMTPAGNLGDDGDGELTDPEFRKVVNNGNKEMEKTANKKGIKVVFAKTPYKPVAGSPGASLHKEPTVVVKQRASTDLTGATIAHEIGHVLTLECYFA